MTHIVSDCYFGFIFLSFNGIAIKKSFKARQWWCMPIISALRSQRQLDLGAFEAILVNRVPGQPEALHRETPFQKRNKQQKMKEKGANKKERKNFLVLWITVQKFTAAQCTKNKGLWTTVKWTSISQPST